MISKKHAEIIKHWLDGGVVEIYDKRYDKWHTDRFPEFKDNWAYRIKPAEPERAYPETKMNDHELHESQFKTDTNGPEDRRRNIANYALRHACDAGQIVTREEFDRALGDRKARDMAIAQAVSDRVMASFTSPAKLPISVKEFSEIIESVK